MLPGRRAEGHLQIPRSRRAARRRCNLFGSGPILNEALRAQQILAEKYQIHADVWSVTSYNELRREAVDTERWNRLHPDQPAKFPYICKALEGAPGTDHRGDRLLKMLSGSVRALAAGSPGVARHGWLRPQR